MFSLKKFHWFELLLLVSLLSIHLFAASSAPNNFPSRWFTRDDAYYYFKVAQNISEGQGSTFDGINLTNGYHPLWMVVCIPIFALARFDLILPLRGLMIVMAGISIATSILLFRLLRKSFSEWITIAITSFWAFSINVHSIVTQQGMETGIVALSLVMYLSFIQSMEEQEPLEGKAALKRAATFGILSLFVILSRLDGIFIVLFATVYVLLRKHNALRVFLLIDVLVSFIAVVISFISRTELSYYLAVYDKSAVVFTALVLIFQSAAGYLFGLYEPGRWRKPITLFSATLSSVSIGVVMASLAMFGITMVIPEIVLPRAVPFIYISIATLLLVLIRFGSNALRFDENISTDDRPMRTFISDQIVDLKSLFPQWLRNALALGWISAGGLLLYMALNRILFGTFMPVSGQIKQWWGSLSNDVYGGPSHSIANVFGIDPQHPDGWFYLSLPLNRYARFLIKNLDIKMNQATLYWVLFTVLIVGAIVLFMVLRREVSPRMKASGFYLLFVGAFFHAFFYGSTAFSAKHEWYWVPQMLTVVLFFGLLAQIAYDRLKGNIWLNRAAIVLILIYSGNMLFAFSNEMITRMPLVDKNPSQPYVDILPILEQNTEPGALIGMTGGGNVGYYINDRTIMNMDGLINSYEYFQLLKQNRGGEFYRKVGLDYVFANKFILTNSSPYRYQLSDSDLLSMPGVKQYGHKELMIYLQAK